MFIELTPEQRQLQAELRQYFSNLISPDETKARWSRTVTARPTAR